MKSFRTLLVALSCATLLAACGGGSGDEAGAAATFLAAGASITLASGQSVKVPSGTTVSSSAGTVNISGDNNTINTIGGAVVTVASTSTGPADNTVIAK